MKLIFGQQDYAERLKCYFLEISAQEKTEIFSFPLEAQNPSKYVFDFSLYDEELSHIGKDIPIIVAFGNKYQKAAVKHLKEIGFTHIRLFDSDMDNELKKAYFKKQFATEQREFSLINEAKSVIVYMAKNIVDKPLKNYSSNLSSHVIPIQVGAALTDKKITDLTDDVGDNISNRNRHYSETTALYWMWKNAEADYLGLCHYRRLWKDLDAIVDKLQNDVIDVVLPLPTWVEPSVMEGHLKHYTPRVWEVMMDVLRRKSPEYHEAAQKIYAGNIFYACNMLIAKRYVLNQLCTWMFPMVMEVEALVGDLPDSYHNRYCGFCTEQLITLYFLYNKQNHRIAHAEKIFIE